MNHRTSIVAGLIVPLWLAVVAAPLQAAPGPQDLLRRAVTLYNVGEFGRSMRLLRRARKVALSARGPARDRSTLGRIHLYLGLNHGAYGRDGLALEAFREALSQDPTLRLEGAGIKPTVATLFQRALANQVGRLELSCDRPEAALTLDGQPRGALPFRGSLTAGPHRIVVRTPGDWFGHRTDLVVHAGQTHKLHLELVPVAGKITVTSKPPGATVRIDGRTYTAPTGVVVAPPGERRLTVEHPGHHPLVRTVTVQAGRRLALAVELIPLPSAAGPQPHRATALPIAPGAGVAAPSRSSPRSWPLWTTVAAAASVAAGGLGLGFGLSARQTYTEYSHTRDDTRFLELEERWKSRALVANVSFAVAGSLAVTAALFYLLRERHN